MKKQLISILTVTELLAGSCFGGAAAVWAEEVNLPQEAVSDTLELTEPDPSTLPEMNDTLTALQQAAASRTDCGTYKSFAVVGDSAIAALYQKEDGYYHLIVTGTGSISNQDFMKQFYNRDSINISNAYIDQLTIEEGITDISADTFSNFNEYYIKKPYDDAALPRKIVTLSLPNTLLTIGKTAFYNAVIADIDIPDSVTTIGEGAFSQSFSESAFQVESATVKLGKGLETIGNIAFYGMPIDSDLTLSASVQSVGICAFQNAHKSITVMNASCQLNTGALGTPSQIYGYNNSTAQTYATEGNIPFTALDTRDALPGDVTLDGNVTLSDAVFLQKYLGKRMEFNDVQLANGDCNNDGVVDDSDCRVLINFLLGKIDSMN